MWVDKSSDVGSEMPGNTFEPCDDVMCLIQKDICGGSCPFDITEWHIHNNALSPGTLAGAACWTDL